MNNFGAQKLVVTSIKNIILVNTLRDRPVSVHKNRWCYGLVYKLSGQVIYHFGKKALNCSPGCVCLLPMGSDYTVEMLEPGECIAVNFMILGEPLLQPFSEHYRGTQKLEALFRRIHSQWKNSFGTSDYAVMATLYEIISAVDKMSRYSHITPTAEAKLRHIVSALNHRYSDPTLSPGSLAEAEGISLTSMRDSFSKIYGMPPIRYLTMLRLNASKKLLAETDQSIETIAQKCGFTDQFYFSRVFKRQCGVTPSEFRKIILMDI